MKINQVTGKIVSVVGNDIDTDRILPARYMKAPDFTGIEKHAFEDEKAAFQKEGTVHPIENVVDPTVMVVNKNFGCGSSREHAPQALLRLGVKAIVGESFSEIFSGNAVAIGLVCVTANATEIQQMQKANANANVDLNARTVTYGNIIVSVQMPEGVRQQFVSGKWDSLSQMISEKESVSKVASKLPYVKFA